MPEKKNPPTPKPESAPRPRPDPPPTKPDPLLYKTIEEQDSSARDRIVTGD